VVVSIKIENCIGKYIKEVGIGLFLKQPQAFPERLTQKTLKPLLQ
jgi:hypothetical protein